MEVVQAALLHQEAMAAHHQVVGVDPRVVRHHEGGLVEGDQVVEVVVLVQAYQEASVATVPGNLEVSWVEEEEVTFQEEVILQACVVGTHVVVVVEVLVVEPYWDVNHVEKLFLLLDLILQMMKAWTLRTVVAHFFFDLHLL